MSYSPTLNCASIFTAARLGAASAGGAARRHAEPHPHRRAARVIIGRGHGSCSQYSTRRGAVSWSTWSKTARRQRLHVLLLEHDRHGDDHREVLRRALVVVLHREHRARAVAHQHHLRRVVRELRVRAAHVEAAERARVSRVRRRCHEHGHRRTRLFFIVSSSGHHRQGRERAPRRLPRSRRRSVRPCIPRNPRSAECAAGPPTSPRERVIPSGSGALHERREVRVARREGEVQRGDGHRRRAVGRPAPLAEARVLAGHRACPLVADDVPRLEVVRRVGLAALFHPLASADDGRRGRKCRSSPSVSLP